MGKRYVRIIRFFSRAWELNALTMESGDNGAFRSWHEVVNQELDDLQTDGLIIVSVQSQDTLIHEEGRDDNPTIMTTITIVYEENVSGIRWSAP